MIRSAYLFQLINLLVAILMVPLLLRYLDVSGFILWSVFTTFGAVTLQFENAIQNVSVREISREFHSGKITGLKESIKKAKKAYTILALIVLIPVYILGFLYLTYFMSKKLEYHGGIEWFIFILAYSINYYFGKNNSILLGLVYIKKFNNINSISRLINFITTFFFLYLGFSVLGLTVSFFVSVVFGCLLIAYHAKKALEKHYSSVSDIENIETPYIDSSNITKYTYYTLSSFVIYKGSFLVVAMLFPNKIVAAYGLSLQAFTMLSLLALVPVQVWLHKLVKAIASENVVAVFNELAAIIVAVNVIFLIGIISLFYIAPEILLFIGSKVSLIDSEVLLLMSVAFLIEVNIYLLVNFLVIKHNYKFVNIYVITSLISVLIAILLMIFTNSDIKILLIIPLVVQAILCLPLILRDVSRELNMSSVMLISRLFSFLIIRMRKFEVGFRQQ